MASVHQLYACMGCTARGGKPTYFNDYQSAATHYARSQSWLQQIQSRDQDGLRSAHIRQQYIGDGKAGGGGAAGAWRPQPAPSRRPGANDIIEHK